MRWFIRKKDVCYHEWQVSDYRVRFEYNGVSSDSCGVYEIACHKCGRTRTLGEFEYGMMKRKGFVKKVSADG